MPFVDEDGLVILSDDPGIGREQLTPCSFVEAADRHAPLFGSGGLADALRSVDEQRWQRLEQSIEVVVDHPEPAPCPPRPPVVA